MKKLNDNEFSLSLGIEKVLDWIKSKTSKESSDTDYGMYDLDDVNNMSILKRAISFYGKEMQLNVAIEEMSELTKELCKDNRKLSSRLSIAEEIADVEIMLEQLKIIYDIDCEVEDFLGIKLLRLNDRIDNDMIRGI